MFKTNCLQVFVVILVLVCSACKKVDDIQVTEIETTSLEKPSSVAIEYNAPKDWEVTN